jgi:hypothetical protein
MRYSILLEELEIYLDYAGIAQLYQLSKIAAFRDRIYTLSFYDPSQRDDDEPDDQDAEDNETYQENLSQQKQSREDATAAYWSSSDAVYLLAECFRNLRGAKNLNRVELCASFGHDLILQGMMLAVFSRKITHLPIQPNDFSTVGYGSFSQSPQLYVSEVRGLLVQPFLSDAHFSTNQLTRRQRADNPTGLHLKNYRPTTQALSKFILTLNTVESLAFHGCRTSPALRFCHGCEDLFVRNFAHTVYPNLTHLSITGMFISGSRLRGFIKRQAQILSTVEISFATLTDGSWRSIAQGLTKVALQSLTITSLKQKRPAGVVTNRVALPGNYSPCSTVDLEDADRVQDFLRVMILSFKTVVCTNPTRFKKSPPKYHEVRLFQPPVMKPSWGQLRATATIREYAKT